MNVFIDDGTRRGEAHGFGRTGRCLSQIMAYRFVGRREVRALQFEDAMKPWFIRVC
jgi:hypothetical protein